MFFFFTCIGLHIILTILIFRNSFPKVLLSEAEYISLSMNSQGWQTACPVKLEKEMEIKLMNLFQNEFLFSFIYQLTSRCGSLQLTCPLQLLEMFAFYYPFHSLFSQPFTQVRLVSYLLFPSFSIIQYIPLVSNSLHCRTQ